MRTNTLKNISLCFLLVCTMLLNAAGCTLKTPIENPTAVPNASSTSNTDADTGRVTPDPDAQTSELTANIKANNVSGLAVDDQFIESQADFAVKLFQNTRKEGENTLISPLSVMLALAMTANGTDAEAKEAMEKLLGGGIPIEKLNAYLYSYIFNLPDGEKYKLRIANSIWFREGVLNVYDDFLQTCVDYYDASVFASPFNDQAVNDINGWVSKNTDKMIDKIIDEIDADTVMYLINALVFDAEWQEIYEKHNIYESVFHLMDDDDTERQVEMMSSVESLYLDDGMATGFIKNYKYGKYSFAALLPNEGISLDDYIASLSGDMLIEIIGSPTNASVFAALPKFENEYEFQMLKALEAMGLPKAGLTKIGDCLWGDLMINEVLHKTYISVDERGTKAGAVTSIGIISEGVPVYDHYIHLDRPFLYMIIDNSTNLPIFMGTVLDVGE
ncbi:MAG: serpin family protein [Christensenellaceae bacterium]|nr:serpin family protein [Christensenellaceae bacterium]